jgi:putative endopeptidase
MKRVVATLVLMACVGALTRSMAASAAEARQASLAPPVLGPGLDATAVDAAVGVCQNFYRHACGGFIVRTPVDDKTPSVVLSDLRFDANLKQTMASVFQPAGAANPDVQRLAAFQASCLSAQASGARADEAIIRQWLQRIDAIETRQGLAAMMRELAAIGVDTFVTYGGRVDPDDIAHYRGEVHNTRLWADRAAIERAFVISGTAPNAAARDAAGVAELAPRLGRLAFARYDFARNQHPMKASELAGLAPGFDWPSYFHLVGIGPNQTINVTSPNYIKAVGAALQTSDLVTLKAYLRWSFLFSLRGELPRTYDAVFSIAPLPLRPSLDEVQRCRDATIRALGIEFSRELSARALTPEARRKAQTLSESIRAAARRAVTSTPWLSPAGRQATARKLAATDLKIGYPDRWPSTGDFAVRSDRFLANVLAARGFEQSREWRRAGAARSRDDWEFKVDPWIGEGMAAARLAQPNGFPDAFTNSLVMTAAFLLPPRYDAKAPLEVIYGTYGSVFGHELIHVAQTHDFDAQGRMAELWSAVDIAASERAGRCLVSEAEQFAANHDLKIDARRQMEENMADFGGARLAYAALAQRLGPAVSRADANGITPAKRFFYAYAQTWCVAETDEHRRNGAANDGHGPTEFRVNAVLANMPEFAKTFGCRPDAPMTRPVGQKCVVW